MLFDKTLPLLDEFVEFVRSLASNSDSEAEYEILLDFLQTSLGRSDPHQLQALFLHELFLHTIAALLHESRYRAVRLLLSRSYYFDRGGASPSFRDYTDIAIAPRLLEQRKRRLKLNRTSLSADLFKHRAESGRRFPFLELQQADAVLFANCLVDAGVGFWSPVTFAYLETAATLKLFAQAGSRGWFQSTLAPLFGVSSPEEFRAKLSDGERRFGISGVYRLHELAFPADYRQALFLAQLGSRP